MREMFSSFKVWKTAGATVARYLSGTFVFILDLGKGQVVFLKNIDCKRYCELSYVKGL